MGRALVDYLVERSWSVIAGTRKGTSIFASDISQLALGTFPDLVDLSHDLTNVKTIVHCAGRVHVSQEDAKNPLAVFRSVNTDGTMVLARQAVAAGVERFVFLSSINVNGHQTHGKPFTAHDAPSPTTSYGISKMEAESSLLKLSKETGLEVVILRPPLIFGPKPTGNLATISRILSKRLPLPFGLATKNKRSLVSARTLASLIEVCLTHPKAPGKIFLMAEAKPMHTRAVIERVAHETGQKAKFIPIPIFLLRGLLKLAGKTKLDSQLFGDLEVDFSETSEYLGWKPDEHGSERNNKNTA